MFIGLVEGHLICLYIGMKIIVFTFCAVIMISCSERKTNIKFTNEIPVPKEYKVVDSVVNDAYMFNFPQDIFIIDSLLIIHDSDGGAETAFHVFRKHGGEHIMDFGFRGRGPGETLNISSVNLQNDTLYVYDANLRKLVMYDIGKAFKGEQCWTEVPVAMTPNMVLQAVPAGENTVILCGNDGQMRFGLWDMASSDGITVTENNYPVYSEDIEADFAVANYSASVRYSETERKLVAATYIGAVMEIYDINLSGINRLFTGYYYRPVYEYAKGAVPRWVVPSEKTVIGFQDLYLTSSGIYGLIWGVKSPSINGPVPGLIMFDYNGTAICRYELPDILESVAVDENGDIYGMALNHDMEFNIKKYVSVN